MKKIVCNISNVISLNSICDDFVVGILNQSVYLCQEGEVFIVVETDVDMRYKFVSLETFTAWEFPPAESIRDLLEDNMDIFTFYQLDDWKEIKEFIK